MLEKINKVFKPININGSLFYITALIYMYLSIFMFLFGWVKLIISIPVSVVLAFIFRNNIKEYRKKFENKEKIYINFKVLLSLILIVFCMGTWFGWTGVFEQTYDWDKHNSILNDLTERSWPVYYQNVSESSMLTYYLGQYIVPSFIGKIFCSVLVSQFVNGIWAMLGLFLAIIGIFKVTKANTTKKQLVAIGVMFLFSSCLVIIKLIASPFINGLDLNDLQWLVFNYNGYHLQLSSNITLLHWVMPQCIVAWIALGILYENPYDIKNYVFTYLPVLFYSSFAFLGIVITLVVLTIIKFIKVEDKIGVLKEIFSLSNIMTVLSLGLILLVYFLGNILTPKPDSISFKLVQYNGKDIIFYILFILLFLPYTFLLYKNNKKNPLFWIATIILAIVPFIRYGIVNDFGMRITIVSLFIYMVLLIKSLFDLNYVKIFKVVIVFLVIFNSYNAIMELKETSHIVKVNLFRSLEYQANRNFPIQDDLKYNYFTYDLDNTFFYKYLARNKHPNL